MNVKHIFGLSALSLLAIGCSNDDYDSAPSLDVKGLLVGVISPDTRSTVTDEGSFSWADGDEIAVFSENISDYSTVKATLSSIADGSKKAYFKADGDATGLTNYAVYPYNEAAKFSTAKVEESDTLPNHEFVTVALPTKYTVDLAKNNTNALMLGIKDTLGVYQFQHLAGVLKVTIKGLPAGIDAIRFTSTEDTPKIISGYTATINTTLVTSNIFVGAKSGENSDKSFAYADLTNGSKSYVDVKFTALSGSSDATVYIPLPVATYAGFKISAMTGATETASYTSKTTTNTINKGTLAIFPALKYSAGTDNNASLEVESVSDAADLVALGSTGGSFSLSADLTLSSALTVVADKTLDLNLNGHTLTLGTYAITNKGTLNIKGTGTISFSGTSAAAITNNDTLTVGDGTNVVTIESAGSGVSNAGIVTLNNPVIDSKGISVLKTSTNVANQVYNINGGTYSDLYPLELVSNLSSYVTNPTVNIATDKKIVINLNKNYMVTTNLNIDTETELNVGSSVLAIYGYYNLLTGSLYSDGIIADKKLTVTGNGGKIVSCYMNNGTLAESNATPTGRCLTFGAEGVIKGDITIEGKATGTTGSLEYPIFVDKGGKLTVGESGASVANSPKIVSNGSGIVVIPDKDESFVDNASNRSSYPASVTFNSGSINATGSFAISGNGTSYGDITVNGGEITATTAPAIYAPQKYGTTTITGGTIKGGASAVEIRAAKLVISGNPELEATTTVESTTSTPNGNGSTTEGAAVAIAQHNTKMEIDVQISGGTFTGKSALYESDPQGNDPQNVKISVTGGTFNGAIYSKDVTKFISGGTFSAQPDSNYITDGKSASQTGSGYEVK